jgi:hypothetical protein
MISSDDGDYLMSFLRGGSRHEDGQGAPKLLLDYTMKRSGKVSWQLWSSSFDENALQIDPNKYQTASQGLTSPDGFAPNLLTQFDRIAAALGPAADFTPHFFIVPGANGKCDTTSDCGQQCTNRGRYCTADPDGDRGHGMSGADVLQEDLRQLCIWKWANTETDTTGMRSAQDFW